VPARLLGLLIAGLSCATLFDPAFAWFAGTYTLVLAAVALVWFRVFARWGGARALIKSLDWDTTFFLMGVFVLVGGLSDSGWMDKLSGLLSSSVAGSPALAFALIVVFSVVLLRLRWTTLPFLLVMIPVVQRCPNRFIRRFRC
jgi:Na+/H+ antiporter NhaD/arsenite permease-like protein